MVVLVLLEQAQVVAAALVVALADMRLMYQLPAVKVAEKQQTVQLLLTVQQAVQVVQQVVRVAQPVVVLVAAQAQELTQVEEEAAVHLAAVEAQVVKVSAEEVVVV
jgi:hypothetical protein